MSKKKPLHILFVSEYFWPRTAGGEVWSWELCRALANRGHKVSVLTSKFIDKEKEVNSGVTIHRVGKTGNSLFSRALWKYNLKKHIEELVEQYQKTEIPISFIHAMAYAACDPAIQSAKKHDIPHLVSVHSFMGSSWRFLKPWPVSFMYRFLEKREVRRSNSSKVIVPSEFLQQKLKNEADLESVVINNFFEPRKIKDNLVSSECKEVIKNKDQIKSKKQQKQGSEKIFLVVGSLLRVKNYALVIRAMCQVPGKLLIVGKGPQKSALQKLSRSLELTDRVIFLGEQNKDSVLWLMSRVTAVVVSSYNESFSLVALEACSQGALVIGTPVGIIPQIISQKEFLFNTKEELVRALSNAERPKNKKSSLMKPFEKKNIINLFEDQYYLESRINE